MDLIIFYQVHYFYFCNFYINKLKVDKHGKTATKQSITDAVNDYENK